MAEEEFFPPLFFPDIVPDPPTLLTHFFDPVTKEYAGSAMIPPDQPTPESATKVEPMPSRTGFAIVWDGSDYWNMLKDCRGQTWYDAQGNPVKITEIGDPVDIGLTPQPPPE